jgi:hypothetical protein
MALYVCSKSSGGHWTEYWEKYLDRTESTNHEDEDNYTTSNFVIYYHDNKLKLHELRMKRNTNRSEMRTKYQPENCIK